MPPSLWTRSRIIAAVAVLFVFFAGLLFFHELAPANAADTATVVFEVQQGESFRAIADNLSVARLIRSSKAFDLFALLGGRALALKPGLYRLDPAMSTSQILNVLSAGNANEVTVTIPEGSNIYEIDAILSAALVIRPGELVNFHGDGALEGKLFPDTYEFYTDSNASSVVQEFIADFNNKALPLLDAQPKNIEQNLILASILEKEVPTSDQQIVAGILIKRLAAGIPLDVDATVCYAKLLVSQSSSNQSPSSQVSQSPSNGVCQQLTAIDFKIDSPYNSYLYRGLPPGPIGNPGVSAITAALHPVSSPYWYYLSDPKTGKTIFAKTLDEQNQNRVKYLESN